MKRIFGFIVFFLLFSFFAGKTYAADNFKTDYNVRYAVSQNANTHVVMDVVLTNLTEQYYASQYKIIVGFSDVTNLFASDSQGKIIPKITKENKGEGIELSFNDHPIGLKNTLNFSISFDTNQIAQNLSSVWEINIPGISSQNDFSTFNVTVSYPYSLGKPTFIKPLVSSQSAQVGTLYFTKEQLGLSGISLAFGESQNYSFDLTYNLENSNLFPIKTEIALPPSTNYQDVLLLSLTPKPLNVTLDKDGNWLAQYYLKPSQKLQVKATGKTKVYLNPKNETLPSDEIKQYLAQKPIGNHKIQRSNKSLAI